MNVDTGFMGEMDEVLKRALPGERVIPATIIGPSITAGNAVIARDAVPLVSQKKAAPLYGPRKPLREVRDELERRRRGHLLDADPEA